MSDSAYYSGNLQYLAQLLDDDGKTTSSPVGRHAYRPSIPVSDLLLLQCESSQVGVLQLVNAYRWHGFRAADVDPLHCQPRPEIPELDPAHHGLTPADLDQEFETGSLVGPDRDSLRNILARLQRAYGGTLGAEYMHIVDTTQKRWLQQRLEGDDAGRGADLPTRRWLLQQLTAAETLEKVIHARFVGQKRFSLEGAEALIPMLNQLIELAAAAGVAEIGLGMAHRGRLNVLHNVLGRSAIALFEHLEDAAGFAQRRSGDVKYHQGVAVELHTRVGRPVRVALAFNPSHLEIVAPVVQGWVRAQQQRRGDRQGDLVMPVVIHGDAAIAGQGVVMETLNMSATRGFTTGGTLHIVINNQIGFTTSDPRDSRSSLYCTDVMKMVDAPVLHVNGDDPEAVLTAVRIAFDYRMAFHRDVAIDLICYRRLGHNEQDEPMVTQPIMYGKIRALPGVRALYAERLVSQGGVTPAEVEEMIELFKNTLESPSSLATKPVNPYAADWRPYRRTDWRCAAQTAVSRARLADLGRSLSQIPEGFKLHARVIMLLGNRRQMAEGAQPLDWGMAETLAYATLLTEGHGVRLTGQDAGRGTFFHRHAVLHDQQRARWDEGIYIPLQHLAERQARFLIVDSLLSEEAVVAFEYGYASGAPEQLVIWEAQFGDFCNGAQVVIDQFIAAAEAKWGRLNGLTLFLPHGYEGQGPEHSSARIERFLQLCAQDNIQLVQPTQPAQMFHVLRRQVLRPYRKPLVIFTPKSLLRHPQAVSSLDDLAQGSFQPLWVDAELQDVSQVEIILFCSGRIYFDLHGRRAQDRRYAILCVEQLYPFPEEEVAKAISEFKQAREIIWVQDEPQNQGPWRFMAYHLQRISHLPLRFVGRPESASPATGYLDVHNSQLEHILQSVFGDMAKADT